MVVLGAIDPVALQIQSFVTRVIRIGGLFGSIRPCDGVVPIFIAIYEYGNIGRRVGQVVIVVVRKLRTLQMLCHRAFAVGYLALVALARPFVNIHGTAAGTGKFGTRSGDPGDHDFGFFTGSQIVRTVGVCEGYAADFGGIVLDGWNPA